VGVGGAMGPPLGGPIAPPTPTLRALSSLWLVSINVRLVVLIMAGSREGGLSRLVGHRFSSCDGGRSIVAVSLI